MKISIITPSYNQDEYLEQTIQSIINQGVDYELFVLDGGSTDNSVEIIKKYGDKITFWSSEKDKGQSDAINKGFKLATGDIVCWLNSDDLFTEGALQGVVKAFKDENVSWLTGDCNKIDSVGRYKGVLKPELPNNEYQWLNLFVRGYSWGISQPSTFWRKSVLDEVGLLDRSLHYSFDHEFFYRIFRKYGRPLVINKALASFRLHDESKTVSSSESFTLENKSIGLRYIKDASFFKSLRLKLVSLKS